MLHVHLFALAALITMLPIAPAPLTAQRGQPALYDSLGAIRRHANGQFGAAVELLETGQRVIVHDDRHYVMQSVYKLPIAMAVLREVDRGRVRLDSSVEVTPQDFISPQQHSPLRDGHPRGASVTARELIRLAIVESDGTASDVLLRLVDGPSSVMRFLREVGVSGVNVVTTERQIGLREAAQFQDWATPSGLLSLLRVLWGRRALSDSSRAMLLRDLSETETGPGRLRGMLPAGTPVAHKTGTSRTNRGVTAATNDIGIITLPDGGHLAVVALLTNSRLGDAARDSLLARVARAAWQAFATSRNPT